MKAEHLRKGEAAEKAAADFLTQQGCSVVAHNVLTKMGEIDLIVLDKNELVFVEVRYRSSKQFGSAAETVTIAKQRKVIKAAQYFIQTNAKYAKKIMRFDVVGLDATHNIEWIKGAFLAV